VFNKDYDTDEARYLFVRLCLRKSDQWIKLADLKYQKELGELIVPAIRELCSHAPLKSAVKIEERDDIIDLSSSQDEQVQCTVVCPIILSSRYQPSFTVSCPEPDHSIFADDESRASLRDLLECLKTDELRDIVRIMRVQRKENKVNLSFTHFRI
jgi:fanconi-associated nuclease 1